MSCPTIDRRAVLAGAAAVPIATLPALAVPSTIEADPIFAAIEAHREAKRFCDSLYSISGCMRPSDPGYEEADARSIASDDVEREAQRGLLDVEAATLAGVATLLNYIAELKDGGLVLWTSREEDDFEDATMRWAAAAIRRIGGAV